MSAGSYLSKLMIFEKIKVLKVNRTKHVVVVAYPPGVENYTKPTPGPKDLAAQIVRKSSPAQPSDASRKRLDKQEDEKGWQGGNRNTDENFFHHSGPS
ncbi:hypothetical protein TNCV_2819841 [Trichonephila clavipes]|nr:hypothetical protein TNCV_2819841 [Trichonephila clavipes]